MKDIQRHELAIVGFGPAGLATVVGLGAAGAGGDIIALDPSTHIGSGNLHGVQIDSNSAGNDFTEALHGSPLEDQTSTTEAAALAGNEHPVPLNEVARFLGRVARTAIERQQVHHIPAAVHKITPREDGYELQTSTGETIGARYVVVATGAHERELPLLHDGITDRVFTSSDILHGRRKDELARALEHSPDITIVGGSHSAYAAGRLLLDTFPRANITFLKRRPTKPYFASRAEAEAHDYEPTDSDTICPETGRINRFNGIRGKARDLWFAEEDGTEPRVTSAYGADLHAIEPTPTIVQAIGYQPNRPALFRPDDTLIGTWLEHTDEGLATFIDQDTGEPLPNIVGIGIGFSHLDGFNVFCAQAAAHFKKVKQLKGE